MMTETMPLNGSLTLDRRTLDKYLQQRRETFLRAKQGRKKDCETKYLEDEYLRERLQHLKAVQNGEVQARIRHSKTDESNSVYVDLYMDGRKCEVVRLSDHLQEGCRNRQLIFRADMPLTLKTHEKFTRTMISAIKRAREVCLKHAFMKV